MGMMEDSSTHILGSRLKRKSDQVWTHLVYLSAAAMTMIILTCSVTPTNATFSMLGLQGRGPPHPHPPPHNARPQRHNNNHHPNSKDGRQHGPHPHPPLNHGHHPPLHGRPHVHRPHPPQQRRDMPHRLAPLKSSPRGPPGSHQKPNSKTKSQSNPAPLPSNLLPINKHAHHHRGKLITDSLHDLHPAAQTLYDLRGFNIPLGGQEETQRFLRQDPFSRPSGFHPSNSNSINNRNNNDPRTAPLVFPSFYQQQQHNTNNGGETVSKRPQNILNIFGHSQHLSQTKYEPANGQRNSGNNNNEPSSGFRPSQVDVGFTSNSNNNEVPRLPPPPSSRAPLQSNNLNLNYINLQHQQNHNNEPDHLQGRQVSQQQQNQPQQILNYRAPHTQSGNSNNNNNNNGQNQNQSDEPFIYVYDDEDYDEGDDEFVDKPQQQINNNRVTTPTPSIRSTQRPTAPPLRTHAPTVFPTATSTATRAPTAKAAIQTTTTPIPVSQHLGHHNDFYQIQQQPQQQQQDNYFFNNNQNQQSHRDEPFRNFQQNNFQQQQSHRLSPTITPTPNVEIVPSSERKPPPDQSNAITPVLKPQRVVNDDRFRRPTTTVPQQNNNNVREQQPREFFNNQQHHQQQQRQPFNQVVNLNEEEEEQIYEDPEIIQKLSGPTGPFGGNPQFQEPPAGRLRPVNTLVPKNRVPQEDIILPHNFPFHEDNLNNNVVNTHSNTRGGNRNINNEVSPSPVPVQSNVGHTRGDIIRRPQSQEVVSVVPQRGSSRPNPTPSPSPVPTRTRQHTRTQTTSTSPETEVPKRTRTRTRPTRVQTTTSTTEATLPPRTFPTFRPSTRTTSIAPTTLTSTRRTTTTAAPPPSSSSYEEDNSEYYEDYNQSGPRVVDSYEQVDRPAVNNNNVFQANKSPLRPNFNNNFSNQNQIHIQELTSPKINEQPRRLRPQAPTTAAPYLTHSSNQNQRGQGGQRGTPQPHRFREQTTIESPPSIKTTTGKPLYYAGKMLSREGGLYAGRTIPAHHIYGAPVPLIPINKVFDKMPAVLDGHVRQLQSSKPLNQNRGSRVRGQEFKDPQQQEIVSPPTLTSRPHSRLIHPSRIRPTITHATPASSSVAIAERENNIETSRPQSVRPGGSPKFLRPQQSIQVAQDQEDDNTEESLPPPPPPRRKKVRPGQQQKFRQQQNQNPEPSVISIREQEQEEGEDDQDKPEPPRKIVRPNRIRVQKQNQVALKPTFKTTTTTTTTTTTEPPPPATSPLVRLRPRRPRPGQQQKVQRQEPVVAEEDIEDEPQQTPQRAQKRLRPRARPGRLPLQQSNQNQAPTPQPDFSESVSVVTQSSVKILKKPTEAPGRFSSRFRDETQPVLTSTRSTISDPAEDDPNADNEDKDDQEADNRPRHFSPSKPRPTFKPTPKPAPKVLPGQNKPKRVKPQQQAPQGDDDLPPSIRLSAKDVVLNRKPARRIPPGSASDRLKALQERRKKNKNLRNQDQGEEGDDNDNAGGGDLLKGHRTLRRRKLVQKEGPQVKQQQRLQHKQRRIQQLPIQEDEQEDQQQDNQDQEDYEPQDDGTFQQNKREITHKNSAVSKAHNDLNANEYEENDESYGTEPKEDEAGEEYEQDTLEEERQRQIANRKLQLHSNRSNGRKRNPSEVTSDEARSVLGIPKPKAIKQLPIKKEEAEEPEVNYYGGEEEQDYEGHHSHLNEQKVSTELPPPSSTIVVRRTESTMQSISEPTIEEENQTEIPISTWRTSTSTSTTAKSPKSSKHSNNDNNKFHKKINTSVTTSTRTSVSESESSSSTPSILFPSSTTSTSSSSSTSSSTTEGSTTAASLKARLRPNKKLLQSIQPRVSAVQQRDKNESSRQSNLSKLLKLRTSSSTYSPISSNSKLITMATEDPSLPLEDMFSAAPKS